MRDLTRENIERMAEPARNAVATGDIPGVVCLVWRRGELVQLDTFGLRNIEARLPVERDTIFRIASMSKPVTTAAASRLVEQGAMRLPEASAQSIGFEYPGLHQAESDGEHHGTHENADRPKGQQSSDHAGKDQ